MRKSGREIAKQRLHVLEKHRKATKESESPKNKPKIIATLQLNNKIELKFAQFTSI